jgi:hypothetical protein
LLAEHHTEHERPLGFLCRSKALLEQLFLQFFFSSPELLWSRKKKRVQWCSPAQEEAQLTEKEKA